MVAVYNSALCSFYSVTHSMSSQLTRSLFVMFKVFPKNSQQERNRGDGYNRIDSLTIIM